MTKEDIKKLCEQNGLEFSLPKISKMIGRQEKYLTQVIHKNKGVLPKDVLIQVTMAIELEKRGNECDSKTVLYRFYDGKNELLYIGVTNNILRRMRQHLRDKDWAKEIHSTKVEYFNERIYALEAEKKAIVAEKPKYNSTYNEDKPYVTIYGETNFLKPSGRINNKELSKYLGLADTTLSKMWKRGEFNKYWSLIVGAMATANGIMPKDMEEIIMKKEKQSKIYSGIFFPDGSHVTWNFAPPPANPELPNGVKEGDMVEVEVVGKYKDKNCTCDIVKIEDITHSPFNGNILHITRSTKGIQPYEVGVRATENEDKIKLLDKPKKLIGYWGFYRV
jgi:predicted GIY-YIG superfamily endonuclease